MKNIGLLLALMVSGSAFSHELQGPPHLDLEMTFEEYRDHLANEASKRRIKLRKLKNETTDAEDPTITLTLQLGTRLSSWINKVNNSRSPDNTITLTSASTRGGIPIDKPSIYSPSLIKERLDGILKAMPATMKDILISKQELPAVLPISDELFIKHARLLTRQYQSAARYKSLNSWRAHYIRKAKNDVRGHYYLVSNNITDKELEDISQIPESKRPEIEKALINICFNSPVTTQDQCKNEIQKAASENNLSSIYGKYFHNAQEIWNNFFIIPKSAYRNDILWEGNVITVPFNTPSIQKFIPYLQFNIEDEFKWKGHQLKIAFGTYSNGPVLIFKPGVVPHVNRLGGNEIVMDSNQSIEEYESQWTIRHEFGHVLGLPDCYHEFYDTTLKAYVNYQLDLTDLMCSRAGNMNERIYKELEKAYRP